MKEMSSTGPGLSRREFLATGGMTVSAVWLFGPAALRPRPDALARIFGSNARRLSVGFLEGAAQLADAAGRQAVPATRAASSSTGLARGGVRVRVSGLTPAVRPTARGLAVEVLLQAPDRRPEPLSFHAWSTAGVPSPRMSSPTAFTAPVGRYPTFGVALDRDRPTDAGTDRAVVIFTGGRGDGAVRLREGLYLLAVEPGVWDRPRALPALDDSAWADLESMVVSVGPVQGQTAA